MAISTTIGAVGVFALFVGKIIRAWWDRGFAREINHGRRGMSAKRRKGVWRSWPYPGFHQTWVGQSDAALIRVGAGTSVRIEKPGREPLRHAGHQACRPGAATRPCGGPLSARVWRERSPWHARGEFPSGGRGGLADHRLSGGARNTNLNATGSNRMIMLGRRGAAVDWPTARPVN